MRFRKHPGWVNITVCILWAVFAVGRIQAQGFSFLNGDQAFCVSSSGGTFRIITTESAFAAIQPEWEVDSGLVLLRTGVVLGKYQYWADVSSPSIASTHCLCPGWIEFRWRYGEDSCMGQNKYGQIRTRVFKRFDSVLLRNWRVGQGQAGPAFFAEQECVGDSQLVEVGLDLGRICGTGRFEDRFDWRSSWGPWEAQSPDSTLVKFRANWTGGISEGSVKLTLGRCNTSPQVSRAFNQTPAPSWIGVSGAHQFSTVSGANANPGYGCLGGAVDGAFSLQVSPDQQTGSQGYNWVIPQGFTCAPPCTTRLVTITPNAGAQAASGQILCRVDNGQCGRSIASFNIVRPPTTTTLNRTGARTVKEPVPTAAASWPSNCYYPDIRYRFTWPDAPINNTYTWTTAQWSWTNSQGQGTPEFSGIPAMEAPGTAPLAQTLTATSTGPNLGVPALATCTSTVSISGYKATDFTTTGLRIRISGSTLDIVTEDGTNNPNWFNSLNPSCTTSLSINDYYYEWGYIGTYNGNTNPEGDPSTAFNASAFGGPVQGQGLNQTGLVNPSLFSTGSKIYCRIRRKSSTPSCTDASLNCFYRYVELALD